MNTLCRIVGLLFLCCNSYILSGQSGIGIASYYSSKFEGRKTATGVIFSNKKMTAASNHYKLGTRVKVTNTLNGKFVIVEINDRMSKGNKRLIDLTQEAAKVLCFMNAGLCKVEVEMLSKEEQKQINTKQDTVAIKE
jgi:rare lipoprotein A